MTEPATLIDHTRAAPEYILPYLPIPLTSLIGREADVAEIVELLEDPRTRLISICGEAGVGKTRVAIAALSRVATTDAREHVYFSIPHSGNVEQLDEMIAASVAAMLSPVPSTMGELAAAIKDQPVLVFLDAVDPWLNDGIRLSDLLSRLPGLTLVVTTRTAFHLRGEQIRTIQPLPLPAEDATITAAAQSASVQLFLDRIQDHEPSYALNADTLEDVIRICRFLEGIPLHLELAAGRIRILSISTIRHRLSSALDLLSDGPIDLPARSRSIRQSIRWSYDALTPVYQEALRTLSGFRQTFTFTMATLLLQHSCEEIDTTESAMNIVSYLVTAGFVHPADCLSRDARFRLRWYMQDFGREELLRLGEYENVYRTMLAVYAELLPPLLDESNAEAEPEVFAELDGEADDLLTMFDIAVSSPESAALALPIANMLVPYWLTRGDTQSGHSQIEQLLQVANDLPERVRAQSYLKLARLDRELLLEDVAETHVNTALDIFRQENDCEGITQSLILLAEIAIDQGDFSVAEEHLQLAEESGAILTSTNVSLHRVRGLLETIGGNLEYANRTLTRGFDIAMHARHRRHMVRIMSLLMHVAIRKGNQTEWNDWLESGLHVADIIKDANGEGILRLQHALLLQEAEQDAEAMHQAVLGFRALVSGGSSRLMRDANLVLARCLHRHQQPQIAAQALGASERNRVGFNCLSLSIDSDHKNHLEQAIRAEIGDPAFIRSVVMGLRLPLSATLVTGIGLIESVIHALKERQEPAKPLVPLTRRELQVLECVVRGLSDREIADELSISPRTSMTHMSNIMGKLQVNNRSAAASAGVRLGLIKVNGASS